MGFRKEKNSVLPQKTRQKLLGEMKEFNKALREEVDKARQLPISKRKDRLNRIRRANFEFKNNITNRATVAMETGEDPGPPEEKGGESAINFLYESLSKYTSGASKLIQSTITREGETPEQNLEQLKEGLFDLTPFSETITGEKTEKESAEDVLKEAGVGKGGTLSQAFPGLFSKTGEGVFTFKEQGILDLSERELAGLALDITLDPLNFIGGSIARNTAKAISKAANVSSKAATGKTFREVARESVVINKLVRGFKNDAFLSGDLVAQKNSELALEHTAVKLGLERKDIAESIGNYVSDTKVLEDPKVFDTLIDIEDATSLALDGNYKELINRFGGEVAEASFENGLVKPDEISSTILWNSGLDEKQMLAAKQARDFFDNIKEKKVKLDFAEDPTRREVAGKLLQGEDLKEADFQTIKKGAKKSGSDFDKAAIKKLQARQEMQKKLEVLRNKKAAGQRVPKGQIKKLEKRIDELQLSNKESEALVNLTNLEAMDRINKNMLPNYVPRQFTDFGALRARLANLENLPPGVQRTLETKILGPAQKSKLLADENISISEKVNATQVAGPSLKEARTFKTWAEADEFSKATGAKIKRNLVELMAGEARKINRREIEQNLMTEFRKILPVTELVDGKVPDEVRSAVKNLLSKNDPESMNLFNKMWRKNFIRPLKNSLTFPFPGYHIRNIFDDSFRNWEEFGVQSLNPVESINAAQVMADADDVVDLGNGIQMRSHDLFREMTNRGILKQSFARTDLVENSADIERQLKKLDPKKQSAFEKAFSLLPVSEEFAIRFNNHARAKAGILGLKDEIARRGLRPGDDLGEAFIEAARRSNRALVDVSNLGPVDDALAQIIPFYRFTRKNIPFQIQTALNNPQRLSKLAFANQTMQADQLSESERKSLSPFIKDNLIFSLGDDVNGDHILISQTGLSIEELNNFWSSREWSDALAKVVAGQAAPPLQGLYGIISNKHPFFGEELDSFRSRRTYKLFHDNDLLNDLVGGVSKVAEGLEEDGSTRFRYELDNPLQYFAMTTLVTPMIAATTQKFLPGPGGQLLSGALSSRGIESVGKLFSDRKSAAQKAINNLTGMKIRRRNLTDSQINFVANKYSEANEELQREARHLKEELKIQRLAAQADKNQMDKASLNLSTNRNKDLAEDLGF